MFGNFCEQFLDYISAICRVPGRLDLVFDSYVEGSIKDSERIRRQDKDWNKQHTLWHPFTHRNGQILVIQQ